MITRWWLRQQQHAGSVAAAVAVAVAAAAACWQHSCSSGGGGGQNIHSATEANIRNGGRHRAAAVALNTLGATAMAGAQTTISEEAAAAA